MAKLLYPGPDETASKLQTRFKHISQASQPFTAWNLKNKTLFSSSDGDTVVMSQSQILAICLWLHNGGYWGAWQEEHQHAMILPDLQFIVLE